MDMQDCEGDTKLMISLLNGDIESCLSYIAKTEQVCLTGVLDIQNNLQQTALHLAVIVGEVQIVRRLIAAGASVSLQDTQGRTPLHIACEHGAFSVIECFWFKLDELNGIRDYEGNTFMHILVCGEHTYLMEYLIGFGADINGRDGKRGMTPLHLASMTGKTHIVAYLLGRTDIDVSPRNFEEKTPLDYAQNHAIKSLLEMRDAVKGAETRECHKVVACENICSVCQEDTVLLRTSCCGKLFHRSCLNTWKNTTNSCPLCRKTIYTETFSMFVNE